MQEKPISANELLQYLKEAEADYKTKGSPLREGPERVMRKLGERDPSELLRRTYLYVNGQPEMWDLLSDRELKQRGYHHASGANSIGVNPGPSVICDTIAKWTSEKEPGEEIWVGAVLGA